MHPNTNAVWANMSTGEEHGGLLYKFDVLQSLSSISIIHIQFIFFSDIHSFTHSFISTLLR